MNSQLFQEKVAELEKELSLSAAREERYKGALEEIVERKYRETAEFEVLTLIKIARTALGEKEDCTCPPNGSCPECRERKNSLIGGVHCGSRQNPLPVTVEEGVEGSYHLITADELTDRQIEELIARQAIGPAEVTFSGEYMERIVATLIAYQKTKPMPPEVSVEELARALHKAYYGVEMMLQSDKHKWENIAAHLHARYKLERRG